MSGTPHWRTLAVVVDVEADPPERLGEYDGCDPEGLTVAYRTADGGRRDAPADCVAVRTVLLP